MNGLGAAVFAILFGSLVASYLLVALIVRGARLRSPRGVCESLVARSTYAVKVPARRVTWNPAEPLAKSMSLAGPGRATYRLDDSRLVHLTLEGPGGARREFVGPLPEGLLAAPDRRPGGRRSLLVPAVAVVGFAAAGAATSGSAVTRLGVAALVGFGLWIAAYLISTAWTASQTLRRQARQR